VFASQVGGEPLVKNLSTVVGDLSHTVGDSAGRTIHVRLPSSDSGPTVNV
jgi:hypothetical protein